MFPRRITGKTLSDHFTYKKLLRFTLAFNSISVRYIIESFYSFSADIFMWAVDQSRHRKHCLFSGYAALLVFGGERLTMCPVYCPQKVRRTRLRGYLATAARVKNCSPKCLKPAPCIADTLYFAAESLTALKEPQTSGLTGRR